MREDVLNVLAEDCVDPGEVELEHLRHVCVVKSQRAQTGLDGRRSQLGFS